MKKGWALRRGIGSFGVLELEQLKEFSCRLIIDQNHAHLVEGGELESLGVSSKSAGVESVADGEDGLQ